MSPATSTGSIKCGHASKISILALSAALYIGRYAFKTRRSAALPMAMDYAESTLDPG
jgi:hypothetical protein